MPDQALVRRGQRGDLQAFDELMRRHSLRAYHVALAVLHDHHEAQDTAQDAFLAASQGLAGFRGDCEFGTWLHPIVTRLALNKASRRRYTVSLDQVNPTAGTYAGPADSGAGRRRPVSPRGGADAPGSAADYTKSLTGSQVTKGLHPAPIWSVVRGSELRDHFDDEPTGNSAQ